MMPFPLFLLDATLFYYHDCYNSGIVKGMPIHKYLINILEYNTSILSNKKSYIGGSASKQ